MFIQNKISLIYIPFVHFLPFLNKNDFLNLQGCGGQELVALDLNMA
jgi:hypothetical protein